MNLNGSVVSGEGRLQRGKKRKAAKGKEPKTAPTVASTLFAPVDVSQVQRKSDILRGAKLEVLSFGQGEKSRDAISKLIKELGGQVNGWEAHGSSFRVKKACPDSILISLGALNKTYKYKAASHHDKFKCRGCKSCSSKFCSSCRSNLLDTGAC